MREKIKSRIHDPNFLFLIIVIAVGSFVRLAALSRWPMGLHQDEAYSAYNAWSVMHYGVDSEGYTRPVYYTAWGSGMSVLYSYLEMPFLAILGTTVRAIRLPQALLGSLCIPATYFLGKELFDKRMGLVFAAMLAINPWHILQSRFGLDANLAVPMLLFAVMFLCRYLNGKPKSLLPATVFFGLTLYCYAITWPLIPLLLILTLIFFRKRIRFNRELFRCIVLLFIMALPLLLFMAVNYGWIPEIKTPFFSIPKLAQMRTDEFGFRKLYAHLKWMIAMLWMQHDDRWWITNSKVGAYYYISTPFILFGMCLHIRTLWRCFRKKQELPLHFMLAIWFGTMFLVSLGIDTAKYYKVNCLHIPIIFYGVYGLIALIDYLKRMKWIPQVCIGIYLVSFIFFLYTEISFPVEYENYGNSIISHMHWNQYEKALDYAQELTDKNISIINLNHANVLLYAHMPPDEFLETAVYEGDDLAFRSLISFGRFYFGKFPSEETKDWVYVFPYDVEEVFLNAGYTIVKVTDCYGVAYMSE